LTRLSILLEKFPHVTILADEVYEFAAFEEKKHIPLSTIRKNKEKTLTVHSAGKLFNCVGWRIGWLTGPEDYITQCGLVHEANSFTAHVPS
jgi:N-succinyldiaminopimelate aminotransferase